METAQPLHPECKALVDILVNANAKPLIEQTVEEVRSNIFYKDEAIAGRIEYDGTRKELFVPLPDFTGSIPVYIYTPNNLAKDAPILIYFHGGGMVIGSREDVETICQIISAAVGCIVVNVEYRLAPEHPFPVSIDDACTVTRWVLDHKTVVGGSEKSKVGVSGDSGGGTISSSVAHDVPELAFEVLLYPKVTATNEVSLQSYQEYKNGPMVGIAEIDWLMSKVVEEKDVANPRIATLMRPRFDHIPPTLLIVAECDPLRDDSYEYEKKLKAAGVHCELYLAKGAVHGFCTMQGAFPELSRESHAKIIEFVKKWGF